jgi:hypothetical protein
MSTIKKVNSRFLLNPFIWFAFMWSLVLIIHALGLTTLYPATPNRLLVFFLAIILISIILAFIYDRKFLSYHSLVYFKKDKPSVILAILVGLVFVGGCVYSKGIPLIQTLQGNTQAYMSFGIPHVTFLSICLTTALCVLSAVKLIYGNEHRAANLLILLECYLIPLLSYSRGMLIFYGVITLVILLSRIVFSWKTVLVILAVAIIGALLFNYTGNIRIGAKWNDSSYFLSIAYFNPRYYVLKDFSWILVYLDTPLGNLCYNMVNIPQVNDWKGLFSQLIPDFLSKRILPQYTSSLFLAQPALTVSSMFAGGYKYGGLLGMALAYLELVVLIFLVALFTKKNSKAFLAATASLSIIAAMSFFNNMVTFSGYSLFLIFFVVDRLYEKNNRFDLECQLVIQYYLPVLD